MGGCSVIKFFSQLDSIMASQLLIMLPSPTIMLIKNPRKPSFSFSTPTTTLKTLEISIQNSSQSEAEEQGKTVNHRLRALVVRFLSLLLGLSSWTLILVSPFGFLILLAAVFIWKSVVFWWWLRPETEPQVDLIGGHGRAGLLQISVSSGTHFPPPPSIMIL